MKAFDQFFLAAIVAVLQPVVTQAQPCIRILNYEIVDPCPAVVVPANLTYNAVEFKLGDPQSGLDNLLTAPPANPARYEAFWIFDDGEFSMPSDGSPAGDNATHEQTYTYENPGTYTPIVHLTEKKSNTSPPPSLNRTIIINTIDSAPPAGMPTIDPVKHAAIINSEKNAADYPTAFAVSAEKNDTSLNGMFFFFNCLKAPGAVRFTAGPVHNLASSETQLVRPNYYDGATLNFLETGTNLTSSFISGSTLNSDFTGPATAFFGNFIFAPINATIRGSVPEHIPEIRIFPILDTNWDPAWNTNDLPFGRYMAVTTGTSPRFTDTTSADYPTFRNLVSSIFQEISGPFFQITTTGTPLFIRGIEILDVQTVVAIDPNSLSVEQVCPLGRDRFRVDMRMEVCNEGPRHVSSFTFRLIDHSQLLGEPYFYDTHNLDEVVPASPTQHIWQFKWGTFLDGVPPPGTTPLEEHGENCATARFFLYTNWLGVQALAEGGALELCVNFPHVSDTCSLSYGFKDFCREGGYRCEKCPCDTHVCPTVFCCNWWIWVLLVLLVIVLLLQVWMLYTVKQKTKTKKITKSKKT